MTESEICVARTRVRFRRGISLNEFLSLHGTEDQCFDALYDGDRTMASCVRVWP